MSRGIGIHTLSTVERAKLNGEKNSELLELAKTQRVKALIKMFATMEDPAGEIMTLADGTTVSPTLEEEIALNALKHERDHSRGFQSLLDLQKLMGESEEKVDVNVSLVDADLLKRSLD